MSMSRDEAVKAGIEAAGEALKRLDPEHCDYREEVERLRQIVTGALAVMMLTEDPNGPYRGSPEGREDALECFLRECEKDAVRIADTRDRRNAGMNRSAQLIVDLSVDVPVPTVRLHHDDLLPRGDVDLSPFIAEGSLEPVFSDGLMFPRLGLQLVVEEMVWKDDMGVTRRSTKEGTVRVVSVVHTPFEASRRDGGEGA